jgi:hypothetical protein
LTGEPHPGQQMCDAWVWCMCARVLSHHGSRVQLGDPLHDGVLCRVSWCVLVNLRLLRLLQNESSVLFRKGQQNIRRKQVGHLLQSTYVVASLACVQQPCTGACSSGVHAYTCALTACACGDIDLLQCVPYPPAVHVSCSPCLCRRLATSILSLLSVAIVVQYSCLGMHCDVFMHFVRVPACCLPLLTTMVLAVHE